MMDKSDSDYPPPYPHDAVQPIADDVFMVRGSVQMNTLMRLSRNMAIVRNGGELTLINPIRLNTTGEEQLRSLGQVKHIMRIGAYHGMDDRYYVDNFNAELWCQPGGKTYKVPAIDVELHAGCTLPFPDAELIPFDGIKQPESALLIKRGKGILLTADSIQHYGDYRLNNWLARLVMPFIGFPKTTIVGPIWLKYMEADGDALRSSLKRLLSHQFDSLLGAHGSLRKHDAKEAVRKAIERI